MAEIPYRLAMPRDTRRYTFKASCFIDPVLVKPWDTYTQEQQAEFYDHGHIPCDGGFVPGIWCEDCRFGERTAMEEEG